MDARVTLIELLAGPAIVALLLRSPVGRGVELPEEAREGGFEDDVEPQHMLHIIIIRKAMHCTFT